MDYNELTSAKSKENLEEILRNFNKMMRTIEKISRFRYEFLIKILIEKRIIDTEREVLNYIQHNDYAPDAKKLVRNLPTLDINATFSGMLGYEQNFDECIKLINNTGKYEIQSMLERLERLEEKTDFFREKEE